MGVNDNLLPTLESESFANNSASGTFSYPDNGNPGSGTVGLSAINFVYDASSQTYTVSTSGRSQSFRPMDLDVNQSTPQQNVFVRTSFNRTDTLYLSTNSAQTATRSNPRYKYVGGGVWQRDIDGISSVNGSIDAFAYGVVTPDSDVPQSGSANFAVHLRGAAAIPTEVTSVTGSGELNLDFVTGALTGEGELMYQGYGNTFWRVWETSGTLSSSSNAFSGSFSMGEENTYGGPITEGGEISGRLYGPNAEELGASWYWSDAASGQSFGGFMLGNDSALFPVNTSLRDLVVDEDFSETGWVYLTWYNMEAGTNHSSGEPNPHGGFIPPIAYSEDLGALVIEGAGWSGPQALLETDRDATLSDATFDVYTFTRQAPNGHPEDWTVRVFRPADDNPVVSLTFTSLVNWEFSNFDVGQMYYGRHGWLAFGRETPASGVPVSGGATYAAAIFGQSDMALAANGRERSYQITGSGEFAFDFAKGAMSGWLHPLLLDPNTSTTYDIGQYDFAGSTVAVGSPYFSGNFDLYTTFPYASHVIEGGFNGPHAEEVMARWMTAMTDPLTSQTLDIFGIAVGKQVTPP